MFVEKGDRQNKELHTHPEQRQTDRQSDRLGRMTDMLLGSTQTEGHTHRQRYRQGRQTYRQTQQKDLRHHINQWGARLACVYKMQKGSFRGS